LKPPFSARARFRRLFLGLHGLALLLLWLWVWEQTRPVALPDVATTEKLRCVSYAPYHLPGQTPLDPQTRISQAQIRADLQALAAITRCVRTYSVDQGLAAVPEIAHALGLEVWLGAWIGYDMKINRKELAAAIALANRYPETVRGLIVGNEVLLRREQSAAALKELIATARARSRVPVSYADVWEFWLQNPELAQSVDFVTVHILPYWEDKPIAVEKSLTHVADVLARVESRFGKPVLIGETGWPGTGRQRAGARPGRVAQAHYLRGFVREANAHGWNYNIIEAIDQPWKRHLEGTVGGAWGVLDAELRPKFAFSGPVAERDSLRGFALFSGLGALACLLACLPRLRRRPGILPTALVVGTWLGGCLCMIWEYGSDACRSAGEWGLLGSAALVGTTLVLQMLLGRHPFPRAMRPLLERCGRKRRACANLPLLGLLFALAFAALLLCADPRYRDFPLWPTLLPLPALLALQLARARQSDLEESLLGGLILLFGLLRGILEITNPEALLWAMLCLAWGAGTLQPGFLSLPKMRQ
jgi:glucan 1,3-beta-glucosidase